MTSNSPTHKKVTYINKIFHLYGLLMAASVITNNSKIRFMFNALGKKW